MQKALGRWTAIWSQSHTSSRLTDEWPLKQRVSAPTDKVGVLEQRVRLDRAILSIPRVQVGPTVPCRAREKPVDAAHSQIVPSVPCVRSEPRCALPPAAGHFGRRWPWHPACEQRDGLLQPAQKCDVPRVLRRVGPKHIIAGRAAE
eukprot:scaffold8721_cov80-Phaeocystis_antarctica.AAC.13